MYRGTYIDAMGRKRREMGYFSLNKPTLNKLHIPVIVQARDKTSAANKINRKYKLRISPSNLRRCRWARAISWKPWSCKGIILDWQSAQRLPVIFMHFSILTFRRAASVRRGPNFYLSGNFNNYIIESLCNLTKDFLPKLLDIPLVMCYYILVQRDKVTKRI